MHEYGTPEYNALVPAETRKPGSRAAIVVDVYKVGTVRTAHPRPYPTKEASTYRNMFTPRLALAIT